jgi:hypothetical protein
MFPNRLTLVVLALAVFLCVGAAGAAALAQGPPPLPLHTLEGYGGGAITPMAYLVNPSQDPSRIFGKPAMAISYAKMSSKSVTGLTVTQTVFNRIELGYGADHAHLGSLTGAIRDFTGIDFRQHDCWLHNFNVRMLAMKEDEYELLGVGLPAFVAGVHFKYNATIAEANEMLGGALSDVGYRRSHSQDFTFTFSKMFQNVFGRTLIATAGLRLSEAAELGLFGFGNIYRPSFEGNLAYMLTDRLVVAYEYRQKHNPYDVIPGLLNGEDDWHTVCAALILNQHSTFAVGWGHFGMMCNEVANGVWLVQLKYEF